MILDRRPRDWSYIAAFKRKDLPSLQEMVRQINENHDTQLIEDFNQKCEQKLITGDPSVSKSEDLVVNAGLQQCINIILGTSSTRWQYMGVGAGSIAPAVGNTVLEAEVTSRINMASLGWREAQGMKLFFGAIMGETLGGVSTVTEIGVLNAASGGTLLNRNVYIQSQLALLRTLGNNVFILSSVVEFCPVA